MGVLAYGSEGYVWEPLLKFGDDTSSELEAPLRDGHFKEDHFHETEPYRV
ncbi:MAG: hypothetical protein JWO49_1279 [Arthrobacter sp.]|nr:hypothetical protein [Arthrobacter sp.]